MNSATTRIGFNILAICGSAAFAGVMLSIGLSFGGIWLSMPPEQFSTWFAENNAHVSRPNAYVVLVTVIGLVGSTYFGWRSQTQRRLWLASAACMAAIAVITFVYFVPTNTAFSAGTILTSAIPSRVGQWLSILYVRIGLGFVSAALAVVAVALAHPAESA